LKWENKPNLSERVVLLEYHNRHTADVQTLASHTVPSDRCADHSGFTQLKCLQLKQLSKKDNLH